MRRSAGVLMICLLLLSFAVCAQAQSAEVKALQEQVQKLQDQLKQVMDRLQQVEAKPAEEAKPAAAKPNWSDKLKMMGYFQARYENRRRTMAAFPPGVWPPAATPEATDEFLIRRMYFGAIATPNDRTTAMVLFRHLSFAGGVDIEAMYVDYKLDDQWSVEFGRVYNKFGWDAWESSSRRVPFDRFAGLEGYRPGGIRGLYFQGPTDHGVYLSRKPLPTASIWEPTVHVGLLNGNFIGAENNNGKGVEVALRWTDRNGWYWGAGYVDGSFTETVNNAPQKTDRTMLGLYLRRDPKPWGLQAEYIDGELFGFDVNGGYGQLSYAIKDKTPFVRVESYDPSKGVAGDRFKAVRAGCTWQLDKTNELTLEYMWAERGDTPVGQIGLQWQAGL